MSNRAHRARRRRRSATVATQVALADEDSVEEAMQITHDRLVEMLGSSRRGPVSWKVARGCEAERVLDVLDDRRNSVHQEFAPPIEREGVTNLPERDYSGVRRRLTAEPDSVLIVAMADAELGAPR